MTKEIISRASNRSFSRIPRSNGRSAAGSEVTEIMTRQIKFAALLTIMTLALGGLARAQWDVMTTTTINAVMTPRRGNPDIKMAIAMASSKAGTKGERTIRRISALPTRAKPAAVTGTGWVRSGCIRTPTATGTAPDSGQATTMRAVHGATATAIPITSPPSTAAAVMAAPGSVIGPTRLVFKMARQWHAKMRQEANRIIRGLADATMMRTTAIAARTATKAPIRLSMRMVIVPATSLHAAATKLFQVASRDELPGQPAARPGMGYFSSPRVLQLSEQCI